MVQIKLSVVFILAAVVIAPTVALPFGCISSILSSCLKPAAAAPPEQPQPQYILEPFVFEPPDRTTRERSSRRPPGAERPINRAPIISPDLADYGHAPEYGSDHSVPSQTPPPDHPNHPNPPHNHPNPDPSLPLLALLDPNHQVDSNHQVNPNHQVYPNHQVNPNHEVINNPNPRQPGPATGKLRKRRRT